jgi:hypothetical protein
MNKNNNNSKAIFSKNQLKNYSSSKQDVTSVIYEEIGLFPRSFSRGATRLS